MQYTYSQGAYTGTGVVKIDIITFVEPVTRQLYGNTLLSLFIKHTCKYRFPRKQLVVSSLYFNLIVTLVSNPMPFDYKSTN
jgi:hypothetical protein